MSVQISKQNLKIGSAVRTVKEEVKVLRTCDRIDSAVSQDATALGRRELNGTVRKTKKRSTNLFDYAGNVKRTCLGNRLGITVYKKRIDRRKKKRLESDWDGRGWLGDAGVKEIAEKGWKLVDLLLPATQGSPQLKCGG